MKCVVCGKLCLRAICVQCLDSIVLKPSVREVRGVRVYCFFSYDDVSFLLNAKYYAIGSRVLAMLATKAATYFSSILLDSSAFITAESNSPQSILDSSAVASAENTSLQALTLIGLDDYVRSLYSHTGVIVRAFAKATHLQARYGALKARNHISYAGKPLAYRQTHSRDFIYTAKARDIVLVDDIITTGESFSQAIEVCQNAGARVRFCLSLCNAQI